MVPRVVAAWWHEARYEGLMRRARRHTVIAGAAYTAGRHHVFIQQQALAAARIDQAVEHGRRSDRLRDRPDRRSSR